MWLINIITSEEGWHITQENLREPSRLLVFVKDGGVWRTNLWMSNETRIRAENYAEELVDDANMFNAGFRIGASKLLLNPKSEIVHSTSCSCLDR